MSGDLLEAGRLSRSLLLSGYLLQSGSLGLGCLHSGDLSQTSLLFLPRNLRQSSSFCGFRSNSLFSGDFSQACGFSLLLLPFKFLLSGDFLQPGGFCSGSSFLFLLLLLESHLVEEGLVGGHLLLVTQLLEVLLFGGGGSSLFSRSFLLSFSGLFLSLSFSFTGCLFGKFQPCLFLKTGSFGHSLLPGKLVLAGVLSLKRRLLSGLLFLLLQAHTGIPVAVCRLLPHRLIVLVLLLTAAVLWLRLLLLYRRVVSVLVATAQAVPCVLLGVQGDAVGTCDQDGCDSESLTKHLVVFSANLFTK